MKVISVGLPLCIFKILHAAFSATLNDLKKPSLKNDHAAVIAFALIVFIIFLFVAVAGY